MMNHSYDGVFNRTKYQNIEKLLTWQNAYLSSFQFFFLIMIKN